MRKTRFNAVAEQGVEAKRITSSCERCFEYSTDGVNGSEPLTTHVN